MKIKLPMWNGVKKSYFKQKILSFELKKSATKGVFIQSPKTKIKYEKNYSHMTPLKGSKYLKSLRNSKIDYILSNKKNVGNCLEIGGGDGLNMNFLNFKKYTICDPFVKTSLKSKVKFISNYFENVNFNGEKFDTIILLSVLEHCKNAEEMVKKVHKVLKKNGKIYIVIPNSDKQFAYADFNALVHEHITYFSTEGIFNLFSKHNLKIENYYQQNDSAFFCASHESRTNKNLSVLSTLKLQDIKRNYMTQIYRFNNFVFKNNSKIIFLGATNGLNTLLYHASRKEKINYKKIRISDNDPYKWGKYIGSHPLPILPINQINKSDIVCISALSFSEEIIKKLEKNQIILNLYNL